MLPPVAGVLKIQLVRGGGRGVGIGMTDTELDPAGFIVWKVQTGGSNAQRAPMGSGTATPSCALGGLPTAPAASGNKSNTSKKLFWPSSPLAPRAGTRMRLLQVGQFSVSMNPASAPWP